MKKAFQKLATVMLCLVMVIAAIPMNVFASSYTNSQLSVVSDKASTLAPGVTLNSITAYDKNGAQVKMFVTKADMSMDSVKLFASYKDMDPTNYGMSKLTEQVASFNEKAASGDEYYQGTVVAGINASYYNMITGKPTGTFVMNGIDVTTESEGNNYGYFAVMKDGSVKIGNKGDYSSDKGNIQEAIGIYTMLIVDGEILPGLDATTKYPRQTIGITADNEVILMTADGNQAPTSVGLTIQEQAQVMLDLGCVWAGHLDGGGSCTYASKPEGSDNFVITNSPSDGSERSVSNGFIIVSTEATSYEFDHVVYDGEAEYVTPGTSVEVSVKGVSSSGNAANIPEDVTYVTTNGTFENGVFTAGNSAETATITAMYNGKEAGTTTINVVVPDKITFNNSTITVPYGKTVKLDMAATYGVNAVKMNDNDVKFELSDDSIGSIVGFDFTASNAEGAAVSAELTAVLSLDENVTAVAEITLGKGSEVIYDFEDGTNQNVIVDETPGTKYNYVWPESEQFVVSAETGKVHSGSYALGATVNYANSLESGYMKTSIYATEQKVFENAVGVGVWLYIPDEWVGLWARWTLQPATVDSNGVATFSGSLNSNTMDTTAGGTGVVYSFDEPGWHYLYADTSAYSAVGWKANSAMIQLYISDRDGSAYNYVASEQSNIPSKYTFYIDDVTVDYSSAVDDREAPVFSNMTYAVEGMADAAVLNNQSITTSKVTFAASVEDYMGKTNYTGINASTVKAYIDGVETDCKYSNGIVSITDANLTNGKHVVKFSACDKMGNYGYVYGYITVNAENSKSTIKLVPHDASLDRILLGSIYNLDLVATEIAEVDSVEVDIDLDNNSTWQLDYMEVAEGFTAEYSIDSTENIATITFTRVGETATEGTSVLATLPVRVWELKTGYTYPNGTKAGQNAMTYKQFRDGKEFWKMSVIANVDRGVLTRVDNSVSTFNGERVFCDTEMWGNFAAMDRTAEGKAYYASWDGGHIHSASSIADKAATCTDNGYSGRTFCEGCNSVVEWGTTETATGHNFTDTNGVMTCSCGDLLNGEYTDGKTYIDGVAAEGWVDDSYYVDGVAITGVQLVDGYYYDFGDNGISTGKYTGLLEIESKWYYSKLGVLTGGWHQIDNNWHFFRGDTKNAAVGKQIYKGVTYIFDEQGMTKGAWHDDGVGTRYYYGPSYYEARDAGYMTLHEIDGKTYNFDVDGYLTYGIQVLRDSTSFKKYAYEFDSNGAMINTITEQGIVTAADGSIYYINEQGYVPMNAGLVKCENTYYYVVYSGKIATNSRRYINEENGNGLLPTGWYEFDSEGKFIPGFTGVKTGTDGVLYYYKDGEIGTGIYNNELAEINGDIYFVKWSGKVAVNETRSISAQKCNDLLKSGTYVFGEDGKLFTGVKAGNDGILYYYKDGKVGSSIYNNELTEINGDLYFVKWSGKVAANETRTISAQKCNGLLNAGTYYFGDDGKLFTGVKLGTDGIMYYYKAGELGNSIYNNELIDINGNIYFVKWSGKVAINETRFIPASKTNGLVDAGTYTFDENGMLIV